MPNLSKPTPAIACSLSGSSYAERLAWIDKLNRRALLSSCREGMTLVLTCRSSAADDVKQLVRLEKECCEFLSFGLVDRGDALVLMITAPNDAEAVLDDVFSPIEQNASCVRRAVGGRGLTGDCREAFISHNGKHAHDLA